MCKSIYGIVLSVECFSKQTSVLSCLKTKNFPKLMKFLVQEKVSLIRSKEKVKEKEKRKGPGFPAVPEA